MTKLTYVFVLFLTITLFLHQGIPSLVFAEDPTPTVTPTSEPDNSKVDDLSNQIKEYQSKISELQGQEKTLSSQIKIMDNQIKVTELRIEEAQARLSEIESDIESAQKRIGGLESDITVTTKALINRVNATYQIGRIDPLQVLLASDNISNFLKRLTYIKLVQAKDKRAIYAAQQSKASYELEKQTLEEKQKEQEAIKVEMEGYTATLAGEKKQKDQLLSETKNSERKYQELLARAQAEYASIVGIIAGKGTETELRKVSKGDTIATVISGASCNSNGTHLHFTVSKNGGAINPFTFLKSIDHADESNGDPFNPSGDWDWPIDSPIQFNQGFGSDTWYVRTYHFYPSHNGIDISGPSSTVRAVKSGTLFRGSYAGYQGCTLPYVRVDHDDDDLDTFYLHVYSS